MCEEHHGGSLSSSGFTSNPDVVRTEKNSYLMVMIMMMVMMIMIMMIMMIMMIAIVIMMILMMNEGDC